MPMTSSPLFLYGLTLLKMGSYWSKTSMLEKNVEKKPSLLHGRRKGKNLTFVM